MVFQSPVMKWDLNSPSSEQDPDPAGTMTGHHSKIRNQGWIKSITPHKVKQSPSPGSVCQAAVCAALLKSFPSPASSLWGPSYKYTMRDTDMPEEERWGLWMRRSAWSTALSTSTAQRREAARLGSHCILTRSHSDSRGQQGRLNWPCNCCPKHGHIY